MQLSGGRSIGAAEGLERWHQVVRSGDAQGLRALLAEDAVFHSLRVS